MKEVVVTIDGTKIEVEGVGFVGSSCGEAIDKINAALGVVTKRSEKPEFYATEVVKAGGQTISGGGY